MKGSRTRPGSKCKFCPSELGWKNRTGICGVCAGKDQAHKGVGESQSHLRKGKEKFGPAGAEAEWLDAFRKAT